MRPAAGSLPRKEDEDVEKEGKEDRKKAFGFLNCLLLWSFWFTLVALLCVIIAICGSFNTNNVLAEEDQKAGFVAEFGSGRYFCEAEQKLGAPNNNKATEKSSLFDPKEKKGMHRGNGTKHVKNDGLLPSKLLLIDTNIVGSILFRLALLVPLPVRVFQAYCMRKLLRRTASQGLLGGLMTNLLPILVLLETLAMAMTVTVTAHHENAERYFYGLVVFFVTACVNIAVTISVTFHYLLQSDKKWDTISLLTKLSSGGLFVYMTPQFLQYHKEHVTYPVCHPYVAPVFAHMEYLCLIAYSIFHLSQLIDIRNIKLQLGYPTYRNRADIRSKTEYGENIANFTEERGTVEKDQNSGIFGKKWKFHLRIVPE